MPPLLSWKHKCLHRSGIRLSETDSMACVDAYDCPMSYVCSRGQCKCGFGTVKQNGRCIVDPLALMQNPMEKDSEENFEISEKEFIGIQNNLDKDSQSQNFYDKDSEGQIQKSRNLHNKHLDRLRLQKKISNLHKKIIVDSIDFDDKDSEADSETDTLSEDEIDFNTDEIKDNEDLLNSTITVVSENFTKNEDQIDSTMTKTRESKNEEIQNLHGLEDPQNPLTDKESMWLSKTAAESLENIFNVLIKMKMDENMSEKNVSTKDVNIDNPTEEFLEPNGTFLWLKQAFNDVDDIEFSLEPSEIEFARRKREIKNAKDIAAKYIGESCINGDICLNSTSCITGVCACPENYEYSEKVRIFF